MKVTVVPAQVTTVEDRISGNLSMSQIALFAIPIFCGSLLYAVLPPSMEVSLYKLIAIGILALLSCLLAIRIKGKIVLAWGMILLQYVARPRQYIFSKNTLAYREHYVTKALAKETVADTDQSPTDIASRVDTSKQAYVYTMLDNPLTQLGFNITKKGELHVRITEIEN